LKSKYYSYKKRTPVTEQATPSKAIYEGYRGLTVWKIGAQEEWHGLLDEMEIAGETYTSLKYQIEGA